MIDGAEELERFLKRSTKLFADAFLKLLDAKEGRVGDHAVALANLARLMRHTMILGNLYARKRVLMEASKDGKFTSLPDRTPISTDLPFREAIENLVKREPRLAQSAAEVAKLYSEGKVFAMAKSASEKLTERVQDAIAAIIREGRGGAMSQREIRQIAVEESHDWTIAYADTVYETNLSTVYNEGRLAQAKDPDVRQVILALEVVGVSDSSERKNHSYARGLIAEQDSPVWTKGRAKPPFGFRCRHGLILVSRFTLERRGLTKPDDQGVYYYPPNFDKFKPDEGFEG